MTWLQAFVYMCGMGVFLFVFAVAALLFADWL